MRRVVLLALAVAIAVGAVFAGLVVSGAIGQSSSKEPPPKQTVETKEPPAKQTVDAILAAEQATADAAPRAPKPSPVDYTPMPTPESCPIDPAGIRTGITAPIYGSPPDFPKIFGTSGNRRLNLLSQAGGLTSDGSPYLLYSGALKSDLDQGVIVVMLGAKDPCAEGRRGYPPQEYVTPFKGGAVSLKRVESDMVDFQAADGTTGRLNYVTGTFQ